MNVNRRSQRPVHAHRLIAFLAPFFLCGCVMPQVEEAAAAGGGAADVNTQTRTATVAAASVPRRISPRADAEVSSILANFVWTSVPGAAAYEVHMGVDTNPPLVAVVTDTALLVRDLPECADQYWRVAALDADGAELVSSPTWPFSTRCP